MSSRPLNSFLHPLLPILAMTSLAAFSIGCAKAGASTTTRVPTEPVRVVGVPVEETSLPKTLAVTGTLVADETADVAAERDGRVARVLVERGSFVEQGATIAVLDETEAKAQLDEAKASFAWSASEVERYGELRGKGVVSPSEKQRKEIDRDLAKARLALADKGYADCVIKAPFSGLVTEKKISAGAFVKRGQAVIGLVKVSLIRAELAIPESAVSAVKVGQRVKLSVQTFPDHAFDGQIAYVGPSLKSEARTLVVEAVLPNADRRLKPGLFATGTIELPSTTPTLLVPESAVVTESGVSHVFVLGESKVSERIVSLGERFGDRVEIRSGVVAGERVAVKPERRLADGLLIER